MTYNHDNHIAPAQSIEDVMITDNHVPTQRCTRWIGTDGWSYDARLFEYNDDVVLQVRRYDEEGGPEAEWHLEPRTCVLRLVANGTEHEPIYVLR